jgi:hypothetical protein
MVVGASARHRQEGSGAVMFEDGEQLNLVEASSGQGVGVGVVEGYA